MTSMTVREFRQWLEKLPADVQERSIQYIDVSYPTVGTMEHCVTKDDKDGEIVVWDVV